MKYAMMTYTMADAPLEEILELADELDLRGLDLCWRQENPKQTRKLCDDHGVAVVAHTFNVPNFKSASPADHQAGMELVKKGLEVACVVGAPVVMLVTPGEAGMPRDELRRNWIGNLGPAVELGKSMGIAVSVENFPGKASPFVVAADFLEAARQAPGLRLTFDAGNVFTGGEDPAESFRQCASHVAHAHFKDWNLRETADGPTRGGEGETRPFTQMLSGKFYQNALIGEGAMDHQACVRAMEACGYQGFVNIEYDGGKYPRVEGVRRAVRHLRGL